MIGDRDRETAKMSGKPDQKLAVLAEISNGVDQRPTEYCFLVKDDQQRQSKANQWICLLCTDFSRRGIKVQHSAIAS